MRVLRMNPILNVSNIPESVAWFEKLGLFKGFEWGDPPTFGSVYRDDNEIFLCQGGQGSRGNRPEWRGAPDDAPVRRADPAHQLGRGESLAEGHGTN